MTWTHTSRGRALDLLDPQPDDVDLAEIGRALSQQCRYAGCVRRFYSVAEHSVLISDWLAFTGAVPELVLAGLLHDAAEAYTGDITWPMQQVLFQGSPSVQDRYKAVQAKLDQLICDKVGVSIHWLHHPEVRTADLRILLDERAVLLDPQPRPWAVEHMAPLGVHVEGWSAGTAYRTWCRRVSAVVLRCGLPEWSP